MIQNWKKIENWVIFSSIDLRLTDISTNKKDCSLIHEIKKIY